MDHQELLMDVLFKCRINDWTNFMSVRENIFCAFRYLKKNIFKLSSMSSVTVFPIKLSKGQLLPI